MKGHVGLGESMNFIFTAQSAAENGFLENSQVVVLFITTLVFWKRCYALYKKGDTDLQSYGLFISNISFAGVGRELSFGAVLGANDHVVAIVKATMASLFCLFIMSAFTLFILRVNNKMTNLLRFLSHPTSWYIYLAILVFGLSSAFEQGAFSAPKSMLIEEVCELVAFSCLLRGAWIFK